MSRETVSSCCPGHGADHGAKTHHPNLLFCHPKNYGDPQCPVGGILPGQWDHLWEMIGESQRSSTSLERTHSVHTSQHKTSSEAASVKDKGGSVPVGLCYD